MVCIYRKGKSIYNFNKINGFKNLLVVLKIIPQNQKNYCSYVFNKKDILCSGHMNAFLT